MNLESNHPLTRGMLPFEQLTQCTVRIETEYPNGMVGSGTGFFFQFAEHNNQHVPAIVTNRHVIEGASRGRFLLTRENNNGMPDYEQHFPVEFDAFESRWIPHPDSHVDLAVMPIADIYHTLEPSGVKFFHIFFRGSDIPTDEEIKEFSGGESVAMVGYPNGLWDEKNNLPIIRRGNLASLYDKDWNGNKEFLIDAACFPGSSGSPVLLFDAGAFVTRSSFVVGERLKFLGILYAGPQHTVEGEVNIVNIPVLAKSVYSAGIPNHLGFVLKAALLRDFDKIFYEIITLQNAVFRNTSGDETV